MENETSTDPAAPAATPQATETPPATPNPWEGFQWDGNVESLPTPVADAIRAARKDAGAARTNAKAQAAQEARQQLLAQLGEQLGVGTAEEPPDAAKLTEHLEQSRADTAATKVELRLVRLANKLGADADALLDSRAFCDSIDALDVTDWEDFDAKATALIVAARPSPTAQVTRTPVESLRPGALGAAAEPNLDDQIAEATKANDWRRVLTLQNQKLNSK